MLCDCGKKITTKFCSECGRSNRKQLKNPNGYGSVYKLPGRRRRPWTARITTGWTDDGVRLYQILGYYETKEEGMDALTLQRLNPMSPKANITLGELYNEWSDLKYNQISKSTADNYKAAWKYLSKIEKMKFRDIRTTHWQKIIDTCKLSKSTLKKIKVVVVMLYNYAIQNDIVSNNKNYGEFIVLPKEERIEKDIFTDDDIDIMFEKIEEIKWVDTILIMVYTGLRISEMLSLKRENVDLELGVITGGLKTEAGKNRIIPVHPKILPIIRKWYDKNGKALICRHDGEHMTANHYRQKKYYPALQKLNLPKLTPHSCRHYFCSKLSDLGVDHVSIQRLAGHEDYAFTANRYTHKDVEELRKAVNKL